MNEMTPPITANVPDERSQQNSDKALKNVSSQTYRALFLIIAAIISVIVMSFYRRVESSSPQWRHHEQVSRRWNEYQNGDPSLTVQTSADTDQPDDHDQIPLLKWITPTGAATFSDGIVLAAQDVDMETNRELFKFLPYDKVAANQVLRDAQQNLTDPETVLNETDFSNFSIAQPSLTDDQIRSLSTGASRLVRFRMFDPCRADGDVVEVGLNGHPMMTVSLTADGASLCLPINIVSQQNNLLTIRPLAEGTSPGITLAIETSQGVGYLRPLLQADSPQELKVQNPVLFLPQN